MAVARNDIANLTDDSISDIVDITYLLASNTYILQ